MGRGRLLQAVHREAEELVCPGELSEELSPLKGRKKCKRIYSVWRLTLVDKQADRVSSVFDDLLHSSKHRLRKRSTRVYEEESPHYPRPCSPGRQDGARGGWDLLTPPHTHLPPPEGSACSWMDQETMSQGRETGKLEARTANPCRPVTR